MKNRKKILLLSVLIMTCVAVVVGAISLFGLYRAAFEQQRERLVETVHSRARLVEAVAQFDAEFSATDVPGGFEAATLSQLVRAHEQFRGFGQTGEFTLARREGDRIVFLLRHRHADLDNPRPIPLDSELAEPMRRALSGESGTVIGLDYRGEKVLAAYEPVGIVNWGMVAKIDLAEIRGAFVRTGGAVVAVGLAIILAGALLFLRSTDPLVKRLEGSEARLRRAQRVACMGSWDWNIVTNELHWSDEIYRIFGLSPQEFGATYDAFLASVHPDDRQSVREHVHAAVHNNAEYRIDHRIVLPRGEVRHVHEQGEVTRDADGAPIRMVGVVTDITERKRAEEALRLDEARLEVLVRLNEMTDAPLHQVTDFALEEAIRLTGSAYGFLGFMSDDESVMNLHAWSGDAMKECSLVDRPTAFPIAEAGLWGEVVRQRKAVLVNDYASQKVWKRGYPQGHAPLLRFLGIPVFDGERIVAVAAVANKEGEYQEGDVRQLTLLIGGMWRLIQRQRAESALRESEERLQAILDNTTAVVYAKDTGGRFLLINRRFEELFHVTRAEIMGKTDYDLWSKEQADALRANDAKVLETRAAVQFEETVKHDDGLHTYISVKFPLCDAAGKPYAVCGISTDITDRQRAEAAVRESRSFLQTVIDEIPESLMVIDRDYRIVLANRAVRELAGGKDPVAGCLTCHQASHRRDTPCEEMDHPCPVRRIISTKAPAVVTHTHFDAEGRELLHEIVAAPIFDEAGEVVQIIESSRDITARVRAEEQARQRQAELAHVARLGTMGEMAAGLAHELNQPLSAIVNYIQACLERIQSGMGDPSELLEDMDQAAAQAERAGEIIEKVRDFVRKGKPQRTSVDINALVKEAADLLSFELRQQAVQLRLDLADSLPLVMAEPIQIEQVIVNLMRNSLEAMGENERGARKLSIRTLRSESGPVEFAIYDTGPGLPAELLDGIFDPFFTTKPDGMGMGLSISRSIIEAHGGRLWATSNSDHGATFLFTLPIDGRGSEDDA